MLMKRRNEKEMKNIQYTFKRYEKKFLLTPKQYLRILPELKVAMDEDGYGVHTICNIYFDTDNFDLIRASVEKPAYKEKFRLRSYGIPDRNGVIFAEIKKKFDGIVYKRRVNAPLSDIRAFVMNGQHLDQDEQIQREIQWFLHRYSPVPKVFIGYERMAFQGIEEPKLRVTFDRNIRFRCRELELCAGDGGEPVFSEDRIVMEVKAPSAIPLWLVSLLSMNGIYAANVSKYGMCYQRHIAPHFLERKGFGYAE